MNLQDWPTELLDLRKWNDGKPPDLTKLRNIDFSSRFRTVPIFLHYEKYPQELGTGLPKTSIFKVSIAIRDMTISDCIITYLEMTNRKKEQSKWKSYLISFIDYVFPFKFSAELKGDLVDPKQFISDLQLQAQGVGIFLGLKIRLEAKLKTKLQLQYRVHLKDGASLFGHPKPSLSETEVELKASITLPTFFGGGPTIGFGGRLKISDLSDPTYDLELSVETALLTLGKFSLGKVRLSVSGTYRPSSKPATPYITASSTDGAIVKYIYKSGSNKDEQSTRDSEIISGTVDVIKGVTYSVKAEVLRNDLGGSGKKVTSITLDGKKLLPQSGCKPPGDDDACDFWSCPLDSEFTITSKTDTIAVEMDFDGHSWKCDCDTKKWACSKAKTVTGREPMEAVVRFTLSPLTTIVRYFYKQGSNEDSQEIRNAEIMRGTVSVKKGVTYTVKAEVFINL